MSHFIITAIIALAAAKAKAQVKDNLTQPKSVKKAEGKRGAANIRVIHESYESHRYKGQIPIPLTPVE